jgi:hypothetical protein
MAYYKSYTFKTAKIFQEMIEIAVVQQLIYMQSSSFYVVTKRENISEWHVLLRDFICSEPQRFRLGVLLFATYSCETKKDVIVKVLESGFRLFDEL